MLHKKNYNALLSLLKDPDNDTFKAMVESMTLDANIIPTLENLWQQVNDEISISRLDGLIHRARFNQLMKGLKKWHVKKSEILEGAWLMANYQYPDLEFAEVDDAVAGIAKDVWLELHSDMTPGEQVAAINHVLFGKYGILGDDDIIPGFNNMLINNILKEKKGCHLGLAILYISVAQKLSIPIFSVPSLRIFSLAYTNDKPLGENVIFYIDPFNKGKIFFEADAKYYFEEELKMPYSSNNIRPWDDEIPILLMIDHMRLMYEVKGMKNKANDMEELIRMIHMIP